MTELLQLLRKLDISKVELANYLGISRQMLYNYLNSSDIDQWPKHQRLRLFELLSINEYEDIRTKKVDLMYIEHIEKKLLESKNNRRTNHDLSHLNSNQQQIMNSYIEFIKDSIDPTNEAIFLQNLEFLKSSLISKELKYFNAYVTKLLGKQPITYFDYDENEQYIFESIIYSAFSLFKNGGYAISKIEDMHKKFEEAVKNNLNEKENITSELSTTKIHALRELGYEKLTPENAEEVFEKIAEIQTRRL